MLLPGAGGIVLDGEGFNVTSQYRSHWTRWADADGFVVVTLPRGTKVVAYDNRALKPGVLGQVGMKITGRNAALPETHGLKPEALAELMVRWRERALRSDAA